MTREEAKTIFWTDKYGKSVFEKFCDISYQKIVSSRYIGSEIDKFIDEIYDDFESRTCENCKLLNRDTGKSYSTCTELPLNMGADTITEFGCNWFKRKNNKG